MMKIYLQSIDFQVMYHCKRLKISMSNRTIGYWIIQCDHVFLVNACVPIDTHVARDPCQNFKNVVCGYCFSTIYENERVIIFSELLNKCMDKPYLAHLLSSEYNHHVYPNAPTLGYSFDKPGYEASLVRMSAISPELRWLIHQYFVIVDYVGSLYGK